MKRMFLIVMFLFIGLTCVFSTFNIQFTSSDNQYTTIQFTDFTAGTSVLSTDTIRDLDTYQGVFWVRISTTFTSSISFKIAATPFIGVDDANSKLAYSLKLSRDCLPLVGDAFQTISVGTGSSLYESSSIAVDPNDYNTNGTPFICVCGYANLPSTSLQGATTGTHVSTVSLHLVVN